MKWDIFDYMWIGICFFSILLLCGSLFFNSAKKTRDIVWQKEADKTQCAQFHPETGKFEWIEQ